MIRFFFGLVGRGRTLRFFVVGICALVDVFAFVVVVRFRRVFFVVSFLVGLLRRLGFVVRCRVSVWYRVGCFLGFVFIKERV